MATPDPAPSTRPAAALMYGTYASGAVGVFLAFWGLAMQPPSLAAGCLVAVGLGGGLAFLRHSVFHRSDAVRMGWDAGRRNTFQIEVGLANLAWALLAVLSVALGWGLAAQAASFLVFGLYLLSVAITLAGLRTRGETRPWANVLGMAGFGIALTVIGVLGMVTT